MSVPGDGSGRWVRLCHVEPKGRLRPVLRQHVAVQLNHRLAARTATELRLRRLPKVMLCLSKVDCSQHITPYSVLRIFTVAPRHENRQGTADGGVTYRPIHHPIVLSHFGRGLG